METADLILVLIARTAAQDLLLRALYAERAANSADPVAFMRATIEGMIASVDAVEQRPAADSAQRIIWDRIEAELGFFLENVCLRLSGDPAGSALNLLGRDGRPREDRTK